jgi:hypothetical protein
VRADLAQRLLAKVMGWDPEQLLQEQAILQTLARFKYDEYENFEPGVRFVESLAQWLAQMTDMGHRRAAYEFIRKHLVFISSAEMQHLVRTVYPDVIRPIIRETAAAALGISKYHIQAVEQSPKFQELLRRSLFLGLSDGARIDAFRRSSPDLDNEQIHAVYEISDSKLESMQRKLDKALRTARMHEAPATFRLVFLLDDFAGTGTTMLRPLKPEEGGGFDGRLKKVADLVAAGRARGIIDAEATVVVCLYIMTAKAEDHLKRQLDAFHTDAWAKCEIRRQLLIPADQQIVRGRLPDLDPVLDAYYSDALEDRESYRVGEQGIKFGYGATGLALVLHHNAPNNSLYLLWKEGNEERPLIPLFRRFERHRQPVEGDDGER